MNNDFLTKLVNSLKGNKTIICMSVLWCLQQHYITSNLSPDLLSFLQSFFGVSGLWAL